MLARNSHCVDNNHRKKDDSPLQGEYGEQLGQDPILGRRISSTRGLS